MTTEAFPVAVTLEDLPDESDAKANTKTKIITAGGLGALSLAAWYAESRGWVSGWPPPFHSLRHPAIGYGGAWLASKLGRRRTGIIAGGAAGNAAAESAQDLINRPDHHPLHWANIADGSHNHNADNIDNVFDLAMAMGGTALFLAQNKGVFTTVRLMLEEVKLSLGNEPPILPDPVD